MKDSLQSYYCSPVARFWLWKLFRSVLKFTWGPRKRNKLSLVRVLFRNVHTSQTVRVFEFTFRRFALDHSWLRGLEMQCYDLESKFGLSQGERQGRSKWMTWKTCHPLALFGKKKKRCIFTLLLLLLASFCLQTMNILLFFSQICRSVFMTQPNYLSVKIIDSWNHLGWKRPAKSSSPSAWPTESRH